jgi:hypothetical protein
MTAPLTYTLFIDPSNHIHTDDEVVARELPLAEAMKTAMEHSGEFRVVLAHDDYDAFRVFTLYRFSKRTFVTNREKLFATVPRTADLVADEAAARQIIETQFLRWQRKFWKGAIMTSQDYAAREKHVARRREVDRIDKEIATKLIDALILGGYTITGDLLDDDGAFDHSTDRDGILKHLFDVEMAELLVHKEGDTAWLRLIFMESGWDLIQDYSETLSPVIDPIVEPYLPWNQPNGRELDRGYSVFVLKSPEDLLEVAKHLK